MPSTNQTDLAGREWRTTKEERAAWRSYWQDVRLLDDLETALAKIEALGAERDEARKDVELECELARNAEARVKALEAERDALDAINDDLRSVLGLGEAQNKTVEGEVSRLTRELATARAVSKAFADAKEQWKARVTALEGALVREKRARLWLIEKASEPGLTDAERLSIIAHQPKPLINPDPAEQPEAGR